MGNIIKEKSDLLLFKDIIEYTKKHGLTASYLGSILNELLPKDNEGLLTRYNVMEKGSITGMFVPDSNKILFSLDKVNTWIDKQVADFSVDGNISDKNTLRCYMILFMITHEIEHAYQYLMGKDIIEAPNDVLKKAYNGLFDLMVKHHYILPRPVTVTKKTISTILYKANENNYLLERNANILSMEAIRNSALYNNNEEIYKLFDDMMRTYLVCGYTESNMGSIEETYRKILMYHKYRKFYQDTSLTDKDRVRYGFEIDDNTRRKVLSLKMDI